MRKDDIPLPKKPARAVHKAGVMNKTEQAYAALLEGDRKAGLIVAWWFEAIKLKLGDNCFYTPDFLIQRADGVMEIHEVKGHWEDDARVKIKAAAAKFPFVFKAVRKGKDGMWHDEFLTKEAPVNRCRQCHRAKIHMLDGQETCFCDSRSFAFDPDAEACSRYLRKEARV